VNEMTNKQQIKLVQELFPGYDQSLHSKCRHPNRYGIKRVDAAEEAMKARTVNKPRRAAKSDFRRKPYKHTYWLSGQQEGALHKAKTALGAKSQQAVVETALNELFERIENEKENGNV